MVLTVRAFQRRPRARLKAVWEQEYDAWSKQSLEGKEYVYVWADGIHTNIRLEDDRQCILVLMGATKDGKELIAMTDDRLGGFGSLCHIGSTKPPCIAV